MTTYAQGSVELQKVTYPGHNGETPIVDQLAVADIINPVVRTEAFVALTPNEIELNREAAYLQYNPLCTK